MTIFQALIKKETLHLLRDRRTLLIVLVMPIVLLLLFGFAISTEVNNVRMVAVVDQHSDETRQLLMKFQTNSYFTFQGIVPFSEVEPMMKRGQTDAALVLKTDNGRLSHQVIVDASNTNMAQTAASYIESVATRSAMTPVLTNVLYNPELKSSYNFVPGIMGMIFILICAMMTSVSIVSEKETGTMDLLLVSPIRPRTIILGKLVPYFALSCMILALILTLGFTVLGLPLSGSVFNVIWVSLLYIVLSLSLGLLISTFANNQVVALLISAVICMLPVVMLSGMIFPIDNMPTVLQWISAIIPARWYIEAMRTLMIQQLPLDYVITEVSVLLAMTVLVLVLSIKSMFKNKC